MLSLLGKIDTQEWKSKDRFWMENNPTTKKKMFTSHLWILFHMLNEFFSAFAIPRTWWKDWTPTPLPFAFWSVLPYFLLSVSSLTSDREKLQHGVTHINLKMPSSIQQIKGTLQKNATTNRILLQQRRKALKLKRFYNFK